MHLTAYNSCKRPLVPLHRRQISRRTVHAVRGRPITHDRPRAARRLATPPAGLPPQRRLCGAAGGGGMQIPAAPPHPSSQKQDPRCSYMAPAGSWPHGRVCTGVVLPLRPPGEGSNSNDPPCLVAPPACHSSQRLEYWATDHRLAGLGCGALQQLDAGMGAGRLPSCRPCAVP